MFEKVKNLTYNIFKATQAIHTSVDEISKSLSAATLELHNHINKFNAMKYVKFVENVIDQND